MVGIDTTRSKGKLVSGRKKPGTATTLLERVIYL